VFAWVASFPGAGPGDRPRSVHRCLERFLALARLDPAQYVRDVRTEVAKVTWPSRKETLITTGLVLAMSALAAVFFLVVDQVIALGMRSLFGMG
jgi:preprotein translocase subunit SecE